jgi:hydrogenase-4 component B
MTASFIPIFLALCVLGIVIALVMPDWRNPAALAVVASLAALTILIGSGAVLFSGSPLHVSLWSVPLLGRLELDMDRLSALFVFITALVYLPVSVFSASYLPRYYGHYSLNSFSVFYHALFASIVLVLLAGDCLLFLLAWEAMAILSYLLVNYEHEREQTTQAGYVMLVMSEAGMMSALLGLLLLAANAGSLDFADLKSSGVTLGSGSRWAVFLLTFFGFGVKAGLVPSSAWLPRAHPAATSNVSALLSGVILNLGIYGIVRVNVDLLPVTTNGPGVLVLLVGTISALVGILYATTENDLKTLLAHSSIENMGLVTVGLGAGLLFAASGKSILASIAFLTALYHLTNHSLYKSLLFLGAGVVDDRAGTRDLDQLGGLIRRMPGTAAAFLAGALAIAALPPFNGFVSEWLTLQTLLRSAELPSVPWVIHFLDRSFDLPPVTLKIIFALCGAGLALTAALAVTCFVKMFAMGFLGMARSPEAEQATEAKPSALAAMAFLAALCLLLGVLPTYVIGVLDRVTQPLTRSSAAAALVAPGPGLVILHRGGATNPVVFAGAPTYLIIVLAGLLVVTFSVVRWALARHRTIARRVCWDGGIRRLLPEMTYTATGFSNPVRVIFQAIFRPTIVEDTRETVAEHFRTAIRRQSETVHIVDRIVLQPALELTLRVSRFFARMHQGRINSYTAYVLLALVIALLFGLTL